MENIKVKTLILIIILCLLFLYLLPINGIIESIIYGGYGVVEFGTNYLNYPSFILLVSVLFFYPKIVKVDGLALFYYIVIFLLYLISFLFVPPHLYKYYFYQLIFILVAILSHAAMVANYKEQNTPLLLNTLKVLFFISLIFSFIMFIYQAYTLGILGFFTDYYVVSEYMFNLGTEKQQFGNLLALLICYSLFFIKNIRLKIMSFLWLLIVGWGIRTLFIGLVVSYALVYVKNLKYLISGAVILVVAFVFFLSKSEYFSFDLLYYGTRYYSYMNAVYIMTIHKIGVGLGGYSLFTDENNDQLMKMFYDPSATYQFLPVAPESDVVHLLGSLGVLGVIHIIILLLIAKRVSGKFISATRFEKFVIFNFLCLLFAGISQDNMFSMFYWISLGLATGAAHSICIRDNN